MASLKDGFMQPIPLWVFFSFCLYKFYSMISSAVCVFITNRFISSRYFNLTFCLFGFVNLMTVLLGALL